MTTPDAGNPAPDSPDGGPAMRASDVERHEVAVTLQDAVARGLLTPDEGSERMAAAWAARYRHELGPLTADLPRPGPTAAAPPGWRELGTMTLARVRTSARELAAEGPRSPRVVATVVALLLGLLVVASLAGLVLDGLVHGGPPGGGLDHDGWRHLHDGVGPR